MTEDEDKDNDQEEVTAEELHDLTRQVIEIADELGVDPEEYGVQRD